MKKSLILYIDTSSKDLVTVNLDKKITSLNTKAQSTLLLVDKLLKEDGLSLLDIKEIEVNTGPGSFVGLRVGVSIANTLAHLLNIPVNGQKPPVLPRYEI